MQRVPPALTGDDWPVVTATHLLPSRSALERLGRQGVVWGLYVAADKLRH